MGIRTVYKMALTLLWAPWFAHALEAGDRVVSKEFIVEPPTLISLGFEWHIEGDDNRNAAVAAFYRHKSGLSWKQGLPLLRLQNEPTVSGPMAYIAPNMFAGSIFDLEPGTEYECRFVLADPDGIDGRNEYRVTVRTRAEPKPFAGGRVYHVYPGGYTGPKQAPAFTGLGAAYFMGSSHTDNHNTFPPRVQPGDFDFRLLPNSVAVDAGVRLPNINDDFTGRAPDLGAYEVGGTLPQYGPRP